MTEPIYVNAVGEAVCIVWLKKISDIKLWNCFVICRWIQTFKSDTTAQIHNKYLCVFVLLNFFCVQKYTSISPFISLSILLGYSHTQQFLLLWFYSLYSFSNVRFDLRLFANLHETDKIERALKFLCCKSTHDHWWPLLHSFHIFTNLFIVCSRNWKWSYHVYGTLTFRLPAI